MLLMSDRPNHRIRILLADDHGIVRAGLRALLEAQADMVVVAEAEMDSMLLLPPRHTSRTLCR